MEKLPGMRVAKKKETGDHLFFGEPALVAVLWSSMMQPDSNVSSRRFTRAFVAVALFTVIVLVCIEAIGVWPLVH
jgi:hypothetical protein